MSVPARKLDATQTTIPPEVYARWRALPHGDRSRPCGTCGRTHDAEGNRLYVRGHRRNALRCLFCFAHAQSRRFT